MGWCLFVEGNVRQELKLRRARRCRHLPGVVQRRTFEQAVRTSRPVGGRRTFRSWKRSRETARMDGRISNP